MARSRASAWASSCPEGPPFAGMPTCCPLRPGSVLMTGVWSSVGTGGGSVTAGCAGGGVGRGAFEGTVAAGGSICALEGCAGGGLCLRGGSHGK